MTPPPAASISTSSTPLMCFHGRETLRNRITPSTAGDPPLLPLCTRDCPRALPHGRRFHVCTRKTDPGGASASPLPPPGAAVSVSPKHVPASMNTAGAITVKTHRRRPHTCMPSTCVLASSPPALPPYSPTHSPTPTPSAMTCPRPPLLGYGRPQRTRPRCCRGRCSAHRR